MNQKTILTGITTTGRPHLGNYAGAIRPAIEASFEQGLQSFYFLADYHSLVKNKDPKEVKKSCMEVAATWLALGLDTKKTYFYRQSDIPEIPELMWILSTFTAKGLMNRAHAYKAAVFENEKNDPDKGITMGLFNYPVLMAADILMFNADVVPVGQDQKQHVEMTRDIALRFNHHYGEVFTIPDVSIEEDAGLLPGTDGRKMSKSYQNVIPIFLKKDDLRKRIMKIKTDSKEPGEPKEINESSIFSIYRAFASDKQTKNLANQYQEGIAWGEAKELLFELLEEKINPFRKNYEELIKDRPGLEKILLLGAQKALDVSTPIIKQVRRAGGIREFGD
jgi:tryptophanyl-tRNA synthetase